MDNRWITHRLEPQPTDSQGLDREWLLSNGTGAFALGTVGGFNTRRYHGLFIAAANPPVGRVLALNQMLERLIPERGRPVEFSSSLFLDSDGHSRVYAPAGHQMLRAFEKGLHVAWHYEHGPLRFTRELFLHWREQAATLRYTLRGVEEPAVLSLSPMLTLRDYHSLLTDPGRCAFVVQPQQDVVNVRRDGLSVTLVCPGSRFLHDEQWWHNFHYPVERERGQADHEHAFLPGRFQRVVEPGEETVIELSVALGEIAEIPRPDIAARAQRLQPMLESLETEDETLGRTLAIAADDFLALRRVQEEELTTILAGFPWFADWGRDVFIALPGLLLETGRFEEAEQALRLFAESLQRGLTPNRFDDYDQRPAGFNSVDASLWFVHAALEFTWRSGDRGPWEAWLAESVIEVLEAYREGTDFNIRLDGDGLITAGSPQTQLTWMDAACNGVVFTPRWGKAVEINALWHHVLLGVAELVAEEDQALADRYTRLAQRARQAFARTFWNPRRGYLNDCVWRDEQGQTQIDDTLRPNQIFALSLPHSPLPRLKQKAVLESVTARLLTPFGLRTLPEDDPRYHGRYAGPPFERDRAYHQGTVWPWLIGPYIEALLRVGQFSAKAREQARRALQPLLETMRGPGLGQLHEIHEADPPHRPVGCPAQAWSVAETLRAWRLIEREEKP